MKYSSMRDKTVCITGSTGGIGREICFHLASLGATLILLDRNTQKSEILEKEIRKRYPNVTILRKTLNLANFENVKLVTKELKELPIDILILNSGVYAVPKVILDTGYNNIFQVNFISHYYLVRELLPSLKTRKGRVIAMGSIAYKYSKTEPDDIDFTNVHSCEKVYGNSKRYLMFSLLELFEGEKDATLSVVHPGITFTNITTHYPKLLFAIIKYPMKIIFMRPKKASLCVIEGIFKNHNNEEWIGPKIFNIWGKPNVKRIRGINKTERQQIFEAAEKIYSEIKNKAYQPS